MSTPFCELFRFFDIDNTSPRLYNKVYRMSRRGDENVAEKNVGGAELITEQLKTGAFSPVYYIFGNEPYLKFFYIEKLRDAFLDEDVREDVTYRYDGETLSADEFESAAGSFSMLSDRKVVIVNDAPVNGDVAEFCLNNPDVFSSDGMIIFYDAKDEYDKRSETAKKFIDLIRERGSLVRIDSPDEKTLVRWIGKQCALEGLSVSEYDAKYLLDCIGPSMLALRSEIKKIRSYTDDGRLKASDVEAVCHNSAEIKGYLITNAIIEGDPGKAFTVIEDFLKTKDGNEQILAATVFGYIGKLWKVKLMLDLGRSESEIAKAIGVKNAFSYIKCARRHTPQDLDDAVEICVKADLALKSTATPPNAVLYRLVAELTERL